MGFAADYADGEPPRTEIDAVAGALVVEFGAPWCPHCIHVQPMLAELLERFPEVRHIKIYDRKGQPLGRSFRVKLWPNFVFMRDGEVVMQVARPDETEMLAGLSLISDAGRSMG